MIHRPVILLALCSVLLGVEAGAQRKPPPVGIAPPQPVALTVKVRREGRTEIPLRIYGRANEPLKYLIRTAPEHGKLSEPRQTEREAAVVVYEPPADLTIPSDRFFYAVQNTIGVSAAVEVNIAIIDRPPQLGIIDTLEFPTTRAGTTQARLLELTNKGGLIAAGEVIVDAPWRIEGKSTYQLRAGDVAVFKIVFAPITGGDFDGVARYTSDPEHSTTLRGSAETAITATPAQVVLRHQPGDPIRTGEVELSNQTDEARMLQLKADARLQLPPRITVPPLGKIVVPIQTVAGDTRAFDVEIRLEAPDFSLTVPVSAPVVGPVMRVSSRAMLFGRVPVGRPASAPFEVENIGGTAGEIRWEIGPPFRGPQTSVLLTPGEKRGFTIELDTKSAGKFRTWLKFKAGNQSFELPVEAEVTALGHLAAAMNALRETGEPAPAPTVPEAPVEEVKPTVPFEWFGDAVLPPGVKTTNLTPTSVQIEWPASLSTASRFRLEVRQFGFDPQGNLQVTWLAPAGVPIEPRDQRHVATLGNLQPAQPWTVRILPLNDAGEPGERLFAIDFQTPRKPSRLPEISAVRGLLVALLALVAWQAWRWWRRHA